MLSLCVLRRYALHLGTGWPFDGGWRLRYDDTIGTVIAQSGISPDARRAAWRQLVDLVAQSRTDSDQIDTVYGTLRAWREFVPFADRAKAARAIAGRRVPPALFAFFAEDGAGVAAPLARAARFSVSEWTALLPMLSPPVRGLLRHREDLPVEVRLALDSFGPTDFVIAASDAAIVDQPTDDAPPAPDPLTGGVAIRALVERIAAYRKDHPVRAIEPDPAPPEESATAFRFETGTDGILIWVEGAPREALIGLSIASVADTHDHGVDGHVAGAYRRRSSFRDARLSIAGVGPVAGEWRISGVPFFDRESGRFTGYRGSARRPRVDEVAHTSAMTTAGGTALPAESLRQLVHELRTPLNAILGFAEMIDNQMLGPAAHDYRSKAVEIHGEARRLLSAVDDIDTAARVDSNTLRMQPVHVDGSALLANVCQELAPLSNERGVHLRVVVGRDLPALASDPATAERMYSRLLAAVIGVSDAGEMLPVRLEVDGGQVALRVARPRALRGQDEPSLLDPGYTPEGDWPEAPLLGLGFALRLVRNLVNAAGGQFAISNDAFVLMLPSATDAVGAGEQNG